METNRKTFMNTTGLPTDVVSFKYFYNGVIPDHQQYEHRIVFYSVFWSKRTFLARYSLTNDDRYKDILDDEPLIKSSNHNPQHFQYLPLPIHNYILTYNMGNIHLIVIQDHMDTIMFITHLSV